MVNSMQEEFGRQAAAMASAPAFNEEYVLKRIVAAVVSAPADRVLEVACGPGIVAEALAPHVGELVCVDATAQMIALSKERLAKSGSSNVTCLEAFGEKLPFGDAAFDTIVTRLSLHHFPDIAAVLSECRRVLSPQGRLVVADILTSADPEEARLHNALEQLRDPSHVRMLPQLELLETLRAGGFTPQSGESWVQQRSFADWAKIVSSPGRTAPLFEVMRNLCRAGLTAGLALQEVGDELFFKHTWLLVVAENSH